MAAAAQAGPPRCVVTPAEAADGVYAPRTPPLPASFAVGLVVGPSGSGKTVLLSRLLGAAATATGGGEAAATWSRASAVVSQVCDDPAEALERLSSVGLNTIPSWTRPFHVLSVGEQARADLARRVRDRAVVDDFTSTVNRDAARAMAASAPCWPYIAALRQP